MLHSFGFGLSYAPMAVLAFSTMPTRYLTQGNAIFALIRMLGSSVFVSMILVVFAHSVAEANLNLASSITVFTRDLVGPWTTTLGHLGDAYVTARLAAEVQRQANMVGYINAFHLMTLLPLLTAPLAFLFVTRLRARGNQKAADAQQSHSASEGSVAAAVTWLISAVRGDCHSPNNPREFRAIP